MHCEGICKFVLQFWSFQSCGALGVSQDVPLALYFTMARSIRLADGPDEVHLKAIFKMERRTQNMAKL